MKPGPQRNFSDSLNAWDLGSSADLCGWTTVTAHEQLVQGRAGTEPWWLTYAHEVVAATLIMDSARRVSRDYNSLRQPRRGRCGVSVVSVHELTTRARIARFGR